MLKRIADLIFAGLGLIILCPFFVLIAVAILIDSEGGVFYKQIRVGMLSKDFNLYKFRTMKPNSDQKGLLTVGSADSRITRVGLFLRKYKLDELPQLINVFIGDMSLVGPRPEVRKYVNIYSKEQLMVLNVKPGITDYASIEYSNENEILGKSTNPENDYINIIMPHKLTLNLKYIAEAGLVTDVKIIFKTLAKIIS